MAFELVWETRGVYKRFYGQVTGEDLLHSVTKVESDHRFDDLRFVINDFLGVDEFSVTEENVLMISAIDSAAATSNPNIRIAIVATDSHIQALGKLYAHAPLTVYPTEIFLNTGDARNWLSAAPPEAIFRKRHGVQPA